jgi:hypothetical protein
MENYLKNATTNVNLMLKYSVKTSITPCEATYIIKLRLHLAYQFSFSLYHSWTHYDMFCSTNRVGKSSSILARRKKDFDPPPSLKSRAADGWTPLTFHQPTMTVSLHAFAEC